MKADATHHPHGSPTRAFAAVPILLVYLAAALLSALQMLGGQLLADSNRQFHELFLGNLIAWLPWCPLALLVLGFERRVPLRARPTARSVAAHVLFALFVASLFLSWLTLFRFLFFPEVAGELGLATWPRAFGREVADFFLETIGVYGLIVTTGAAVRRRQEASEPAKPLGLEKRPRRLEVRSRGIVRWVEVDEIDWIEATGSYVRLHGTERWPLIRRSLSKLSEELEPHGFARVHRSSLVNLARVRKVERLSHGEALLVLEDEQRIKVSRTYRQALERLAEFPP